MTKNQQLEEMREFIAKYMNLENDKYSELILKLRSQLGGLAETNIQILSKIHEAKIKVLEDMYEKVKSL